VYYERHERIAGETKYPLKKMIALAADGRRDLPSSTGFRCSGNRFELKSLSRSKGDTHMPGPDTSQTSSATPAVGVVAAGVQEDGVWAGNHYDKYGSRNPIVRWLMRGFEGALDELVRIANPRTVHEIGCGEGRWTLKWAGEGILARGSDFSQQIIAVAKENAARSASAAQFRAASIYDLQAPGDAAELVVCCEVLEHLEEPERALDVLSTLASPWLLASVPREPLWCTLNLARGKYIPSLGNTPGHIQKWSSHGFVRLLSRRFEIVAVRKPLPWTMVLAKVRR
jgi:SAM-dependent methyltransferase